MNVRDGDGMKEGGLKKLEILEYEAVIGCIERTSCSRSGSRGIRLARIKDRFEGYGAF